MVALLLPLVAGQVYPDTAPSDVAPPYLIWQQVGGQPIQFLGGVGSTTRPRIQLTWWAASRLEACQLRDQIQAAMVDTPLFAEIATGPVADHEPVQGVYGFRQDFYLAVP